MTVLWSEKGPGTPYPHSAWWIHVLEESHWGRPDCLLVEGVLCKYRFKLQYTLVINCFISYDFRAHLICYIRRMANWRRSRSLSQFLRSTMSQLRWSWLTISTMWSSSLAKMVCILIDLFFRQLGTISGRHNSCSACSSWFCSCDGSFYMIA